MFDVPGLADLPLDQTNSRLENGVYIQLRGIEQDRVCCHGEGGSPSASIPRVAFLDVGQDLGQS